MAPSDNSVFLDKHCVEAISKPQIRFDGKARANEKAEHIQ
jgi:hypothetical protein